MSNITNGDDDHKDKLPAVNRLSRDLRAASKTISAQEARYLVDAYYTMQDQRIESANRSRAMEKEPHEVLAWLRDQSGVLEKQVQVSLDVYSLSKPIGVWMRNVYGIGPVIAAGLLAHIDIGKAPTVGHIWRFAGLDPTLVWGKGQKRPYNARLKVLCWKLGESFKKFSGSDDCYYGKLYRERKEYEVARNDRGENAAVAADAVANRKLSAEQKTHYEAGKLPPGRLDLRATRYAVKQFLADLHGEWYRQEYGKEPPLPYPIAHMGHVHLRKPPAAA
jgi:hypothetical protein